MDRIEKNEEFLCEVLDSYEISSSRDPLYQAGQTLPYGYEIKAKIQVAVDSKVENLEEINENLFLVLKDIYYMIEEVKMIEKSKKRTAYNLDTSRTVDG